VFVRAHTREDLDARDYFGMDFLLKTATILEHAVDAHAHAHLIWLALSQRPWSSTLRGRFLRV